MNTKEIISFINSSHSFDEVRAANVLPEPDQDDGFYFVSYSHKDYKKVLTDIVKYFDCGFKIWYDRFLESGKSWTAEVHKKIASYYCKCVIVYVTQNFLQSESCLSEIECICDNDKSCLLVLSGVSYHDFYNTVSEKKGKKVCLENKKVVCLDYQCDIFEKTALILSLKKPELFEFYFNDGVKLFKIFKSGRFALVSKVKCNDLSKIVIPKFIWHNNKKYRVGGIMYSVFLNNSILEEVTIPNGWFMILDGAFTRCKSLHTINLGTPKMIAGVKVGALKNAFVDCPNLSRINKSKGFVSLFNAFLNSHGIKEFNTKGFILLEKSFSGCVNLEKITFSPYTKIIYEKAFENCKSLKTVTIPKKVKVIEKTAFNGCENLVEVIIEGNSKKIYKHKNIRIYLDEIFCYAEKIYLKKVPKFNIFKANFVQVISDRAGYYKFVRE